MLCQKCGQKEATAHFTKIVNGKRKELHLCSACASKEELNLFGEFPSLFNTLFSTDGKYSSSGRSGKTCPKCGTTFESIMETGMLGCAECYTAFAQELEPTLTRLHGKSAHVGRIPGSAGGELKLKNELAEAQNQMKQAIDKQEFERAAQLRDRIKELNEQLGEESK